MPELAAAYVHMEVTVEADFKQGLSMRAIVRRAEVLEAEEGPAARPPMGTAMSGYVGKSSTALYRGRLALLRERFALAS
ncbi:hypothetical protein AB0H92_22115 [Streptomyces phaeochromogenes]|uniref:hypothetical protein n=1 Tax=Streptomyces phaeochromogenes TaxID=1923 RepID=UPI00340181D6